MPGLREVLIIVSNIKTGYDYYARSYPDDDFNNDNSIELYKTPVYKLFIKGTDNNNSRVQKEWMALRFMPYWNDPKKPDSSYKPKGWVNAGKHHVPKKAITYYNPNYGTHNRYSPYAGALQIEDSFLIHAGPNKLSEIGWGSAGCVEIVGNFDLFKEDIKELSGSKKLSAHEAILELVKAKKIFVQVDYAMPPDIKSNIYVES